MTAAPAQAWIGGLGKALLTGVTADSVSGTIPESVFAMFQLTFAIITPALVVGAFAERMRFGAMLLFSTLWLLLVYLPVAHWVWGGGWLAQMKFLDFAGGSVVHINAGVAALVAALVIGNRRGFPSQAMTPHNLPATVTGAGMLWVGWFGFNAGSALAANGSAGMAMLVTHTAAAAGCVAWMAQEWVRFGKPSVLGIVTGMVAGLGTITPASGYVGPGGALVIGLLAGTVCFWATQYVKRRLADRRFPRRLSRARRRRNHGHAAHGRLRRRGSRRHRPPGRPDDRRPAGRAADRHGRHAGVVGGHDLAAAEGRRAS